MWFLYFLFLSNFKMDITIVKMSRMKQTVQQLHVPITSSCVHGAVQMERPNALLKHNSVMVFDFQWHLFINQIY